MHQLLVGDLLHVVFIDCVHELRGRHLSVVDRRKRMPCMPCWYVLGSSSEHLHELQHGHLSADGKFDELPKLQRGHLFGVRRYCLHQLFGWNLSIGIRSIVLSSMFGWSLFSLCWRFLVHYMSKLLYRHVLADRL